MWVLLGLIKAIFTDLSGGFRQRKFKNPAEDTPIWRLGQEIRDYTDLLKMSRDEMSEEQRQALLDDDEEAREGSTTLHSFPPPREFEGKVVEVHDNVTSSEDGPIKPHDDGESAESSSGGDREEKSQSDGDESQPEITDSGEPDSEENAVQDSDDSTSWTQDSNEIAAPDNFSSDDGASNFDSDFDSSEFDSSSDPPGYVG